jgi:hypothetical protein
MRIKAWSIAVSAAMMMLMMCGCAAVSSGTKEAQTIPDFSPAAVHKVCFIRLWHPDGSYYMTEQNQIVDGGGIIRIWGREAEEEYGWQLWPEGFVSLQRQERQVKWLPAGLAVKDYCRIVLACFVNRMAAPPAAGSAAVRVLGNWAYPVASQGDIAWYSSGQSEAADIVVMRIADGSQLAAQIYGRRRAGAGLAPPSKIEIFRLSDIRIAGTRLLEIDYAG